MRITNLANVRDAVSQMAWAITPQKLDAIIEVLELRTGGPLSPDEIRARIGDTAPHAAAQYQAKGGAVAVIPMAGTLFPRANMMTDMSGGVSVERWIAQVEAAAADPNISAIVLDIDSPGGAAAGVPEAAARLRALRGKGKPIVAVANTLMASGAYWLGAQADSVIASPSADVGSVGVFTVHRDLSKAYADIGVKHTLIKAGKYKAEGVPFEPLSDEAKASLQDKVDECYADFVTDLSKGRGVSASVVRTDFGEGRVLSANAAKKAGMVDGVAAITTVINDLAAGRTAKYLRADDDTPRAVTFDDSALDRALATDIAPRAGAADTNDSSDLTPPSAEEHPVDPKTTTAAPVAVLDTPSREKQLAELAALTGKGDQLMSWITSDKSVDGIRKELISAQASPAPVSTAVVVGDPRETKAPWESFGHFAAAVYHAGRPGSHRQVDQRLFAAATGMNQGAPSEGGFAVPGTFAQSLWLGLFDDPSSLLSRTDNYDVDGAFIEFPRVKDTDRSAGLLFGGVQAFWIKEAGQIPGSKPAFDDMRLEPQELAALVYVTEKMLNNSPYAMGQYVDRMGKAAIAFKVNAALVAGDGVGKPKGFTTSGCKITVLKETNQAADTINARNIAKMKARRVASVANQYVWLANTDIQPELDNLSTIVQNVAGTENVGGYASPLYNPSTNTLGSLPVLFNDHCEAIGDEGDIILVHLPSYAVGLRRGGVKTAQSMHLRFDYAEMAFRFMFDIDGQTWLPTAITPAKGSTKSTVITLQAR